MIMKTYNIPIFVPHRGCPFDCVFCNQKRITGTQKEVTADDVHNIIGEYLKTLPSKNRRIEAAFSAAVLPVYRLTNKANF